MMQILSTIKKNNIFSPTHVKLKSYLLEKNKKRFNRYVLYQALNKYAYFLCNQSKSLFRKGL